MSVAKWDVSLLRVCQTRLVDLISSLMRYDELKETSLTPTVCSIRDKSFTGVKNYHRIPRNRYERAKNQQIKFEGLYLDNDSWRIPWGGKLKIISPSLKKLLAHLVYYLPNRSRMQFIWHCGNDTKPQEMNYAVHWTFKTISSNCRIFLCNFPDVSMAFL